MVESAKRPLSQTQPMPGMIFRPVLVLFSPSQFLRWEQRALAPVHWGWGEPGKRWGVPQREPDETASKALAWCAVTNPTW